MPFLQKDNTMTEERVDELTRNALAVTTPDALFDKAWHFINWYFSPTVRGLDKLTDKPTLFVGNHALFGFDAWIVRSLFTTPPAASCGAWATACFSSPRSAT